MFKAYGDQRYICLPFVIGMNRVEDSEKAFDNLEKYIALTEPPRRPTLVDCMNVNLTLDEIMDMALYGYNACINQIGNVYGTNSQVRQS